MRCWLSRDSSNRTTGSTVPSWVTTGRPARTESVLSATRITYCATPRARAARSSFCCWSKYAPSRFTTRRPTSPSVTATTATKASVSLPWNVLGARRSTLGKRVPDSTDRLDEGRMRGVVLELVAQVAHVDVDRLLVLVESLVIAQQVEELGAGVDAARLAGEVPEDLELGRGQADAALAALDAPPVEVDQQVLVADDATADRVGEVAVRTAQERLDPAQQLAQAERLGQVVVGAQLQADDLVDLLVAGGEHEHRGFRARGAQPAEDLEAVHARQADVEQDQVRGGPGGDLQALLTGAGEGHLVALLLEGVLDSARNGVLILDDQDRGGHSTPTRRSWDGDPTPSAPSWPPGPPRGTVPARSTLPEAHFRMSAAPARPKLAAARREITGKKVSHLRRDGRLPGVVFGRGLDSVSVSVDAHEFEQLRRHAGANTLIDL